MLYKFIPLSVSIPEIERFVEINRRFWPSYKKSHKKNLVFIEGYLSTPTYQVQSARIAKTLELKFGTEPVVLMKMASRYAKGKINLYHSFGIDRFLFLEKYLFRPTSIIKSFWLVLKFAFKRRNGKDLLNLEYRGLQIGDLTYDTILRGRKDVFTIDKLGYRCLEYVFKTYLFYFAYSALLEKYDCKYVIISHKTYMNVGMFAKIANKKGITVILVSPRQIRTYRDEDVCESRWLPTQADYKRASEHKEMIINKVDEYLGVLLSGGINHHDARNAYRDKVIYTGERFRTNMNINNDMPIVFVMAHVFSDDPHGVSWQIYKDYYTWFNATLKIAADINNVNWVVKPHPSAALHGEAGVVEKLTEKYREYSDNIYLSPQDLSTASIKDIAKAIITVGGSAGLELSCFGIPSIVCSKTFYSGYGFTIEPKTEKEYRRFLKQIFHVGRLNSDQMETAKFILGIVKIANVVDDSLLPKNCITRLDNNIKRIRENYREINSKWINVTSRKELLIDTRHLNS